MSNTFFRGEMSDIYYICKRSNRNRNFLYVGASVTISLFGVYSVIDRIIV